MTCAQSTGCISKVALPCRSNDRCHHPRGAIDRLKMRQAVSRHASENTSHRWLDLKPVVSRPQFVRRPNKLAFHNPIDVALAPPPALKITLSSLPPAWCSVGRVYLGGQGEHDALCVHQAGGAQVVDAAPQDLCARPEPDGLREVDALVFGEQLGREAPKRTQHGLHGRRRVGWWEGVARGT